ncbi:MAG: DUF86 domain-containing protein [Chlorobi bacterium]|nr:DUF86 domain-containing protein [Chlorobiota bacterium]
MTDERKKYLSDILSAIELIEGFMVGINSFSEYIQDFKTQSAVERQLGIIGEAVNKYVKISPDEPIRNTGKIIAFRNRLIHTYDSIDNTIVWAIVKRHLQPLKNEVILLLDVK